MCNQNLKKFKSNKCRLCDSVRGDGCLFYHRHIGRNKSTQRCVGEGLNPKSSFDSRKMSVKPCSLFFLKQHDQSKYIILNNKLQLT
jgi:hypothetical protein